MGKYKVPHFDAKGEADRFFTERGRADDVPAHVVLLGQLHPLRHGPEAGRRTASSRSRCRWATRSCPGIAAEDIGRCAYGIFKARERVHRQDGRHRRRAPDRRADGRGADARARPARCATTPCRRRSYRGFGFPGADDLGNMFQFKRDFEGPVRAARDVARSRALNPALQTFDAWLARTRSRFRWSDASGGARGDAPLTPALSPLRGAREGSSGALPVPSHQNSPSPRGAGRGLG